MADDQLQGFEELPMPRAAAGSNIGTGGTRVHSTAQQLVI